MNSKALERRGALALAVVCGLFFGAGRAGAAQESTFDWIAANQEAVRLDPAGYHTGRVFKPMDNAGNVHVDIDSEEPVTIEMAPAGQWSEVLRHPELLPRVNFRCVREHVTKATYVCDVPAARAMALVVRDERSSEETVVTGFSTPYDDHGTIREFVSPNDIHIQYYRWACVENCDPPRYQWTTNLRQTFDLTSAPKVYDGITAERDGEPFTVKVSSPVPVTVALVPARVADGLRQSPDNVGSALKNRPCMQKAVRSITFECMFDLGDGPQSLIAVPEEGAKLPSSKKVEVEVIASTCVANCLTDPER